MRRDQTAGGIDAIAALVVTEAVFVPESLVMADAATIGRNGLGLLVHGLQAWPLAVIVTRAGLRLRTHHRPAIGIDGGLGVDGAGGTGQRQRKQSVPDHSCLLSSDLPN
jgi:hypothetical protein